MRQTSRVRDAAELGGALILGLLVGIVGLKAIDVVDWPAFNTSNVTRSLTTLGQAIFLLVAAVAVILAYYRRSPLLSSWLAAIGSAGLVTVSLGMPLGATKLYLHGLSGDQQFRTEYLTRLTSSPHLADMTYVDLPPYYPATWFWFGGRYADLLGLPGWEAYKPWSIISLAAAAALGTALWTRMSGVALGAPAGIAVTLVTLRYAAAEPYAAVLILVGVPMLIVISSALRGRGRLADGPQPLSRTNWLAVVAGGLFLGLSATVYTLYTAFFAGTTVLLALVYCVVAWLGDRNEAVADDELAARRRPRILGVVVRLLVMGVIAIAVALLFWARWLKERVSADVSGTGAAEHYLPEGGSVLGLPMFHLSLIALLTLIGLIWALLEMRRRTVALTFVVALAGVLLMTLASLGRTALGSTLLSFRLEAISAAVLAAAGIFGCARLARWAVGEFGDVRTAIGVIATLIGVAVAQSLPSTMSSEISLAYTDTDGAGQRADHRPAGAESYYPKLHKLIRQQTGVPATENIVLTADFSFLSVYPYWGFQGLTSHYANPLAEFEKRAATIEGWAELSSADEFQQALNTSPWPAPNVFLFRYSADGYTLRLAKDVYPNDPNVKRYTVTFDPAIFDDPSFTVTEVGPFVLVTSAPATR